MELLREEDVRVLVAQVSANPDFRMVAAQVRCHFFCLLFFCLLISSLFAHHSLVAAQSLAHAHARDAAAEHTARGATRAAKRESCVEAAETLQAHHTFVWDLKRPVLCASRKVRVMLSTVTCYANRSQFDSLPLTSLTRAS